MLVIPLNDDVTVSLNPVDCPPFVFAEDVPFRIESLCHGSRTNRTT